MAFASSMGGCEIQFFDSALPGCSRFGQITDTYFESRNRSAHLLTSWPFLSTTAKLAGASAAALLRSAVGCCELTYSVAFGGASSHPL